MPLLRSLADHGARMAINMAHLTELSHRRCVRGAGLRGSSFIALRRNPYISNRMAAEERVLCFERKLLEKLGVFQGLSLEVEKYLPVVTSASHLIYLNRSEAEHDKRYKQLIPYVLIVCNDQVLRYRRGQGGEETRLRGLYSVGIGGHISEEDHGLFSNAAGYQDGMRREVREEVAIDPVKEAAVAVINDDTTEVGLVHFGVVHIMHAADQTVAGRRA